MTIIVDTRQKLKHHDIEHAQMRSLGVKLMSSKLPYGDYALLTDLSRVVDSKYGLQEVYGNIIGKEHARFVREAQGCLENGIEFIVLVEHDGCGSLQNVHNWQNPRLEHWHKVKNCQAKGKMLNYKIGKKPPVTSAQLRETMETMADKYNIIWKFCKKEEAGAKIIELLTEGKQG